MIQLMDRRKVVIRKLPPNIPEEDVRQLVKTASAGPFSWFNFVQGKTRCASGGCMANFMLARNVPSLSSRGKDQESIRHSPALGFV